VIEQDIEQEENKQQVSADLRIRKTQVGELLLALSAATNCHLHV